MTDPTKNDLFYARPHALVHAKTFTFGNIGIHIATEPYFILETGLYTSFEHIHNPSYKPCLAVDSIVHGTYYVYNFSKDTFKRFKLAGDDKLVCFNMDINKYYKLVNWMIKNMPCRNPHK